MCWSVFIKSDMASHVGILGNRLPIKPIRVRRKTPLTPPPPPQHWLRPGEAGREVEGVDFFGNLFILVCCTSYKHSSANPNILRPFLNRDFGKNYQLSSDFNTEGHQLKLTFSVLALKSTTFSLNKQHLFHFTTQVSSWNSQLKIFWLDFRWRCAI